MFSGHAAGNCTERVRSAMYGDYRVGGMEDYRRLELNPAVNTVALADGD